MDRRTRLAGPLSSFGGEGRGEEALIPATLRTGSRNGPRKLDNTRRAVTILKASSPQPSPPKEERERHASCVVSIKLNGSAAQAGLPLLTRPAISQAGKFARRQILPVSSPAAPIRDAVGPGDAAHSAIPG